jgi:hypothetical protein
MQDPAIANNKDQMSDMDWWMFITGQLELEITDHLQPSVLGIMAYADQIVKLGQDWRPVFEQAMRFRELEGAPIPPEAIQNLSQQVEQKLHEIQLGQSTLDRIGQSPEYDALAQ